MKQKQYMLSFPRQIKFNVTVCLNLIGKSNIPYLSFIIY